MLDMNLLGIAFAYLIGVISPGPAGLIIIRNSALYAKESFLTVIGVILGNTLQVSSILLITNLFNQTSFAFRILKIVCSFYLCYLGVKNIWSFVKNRNEINEPNFFKYKNTTFFSNQWLRFMEGFLTEVLNPLAIIFLLTIFSLFIKPQDPSHIKIFYCIEIIFIGAIWFLTLFFLSSSEIARKFLNKISKLEIIFGGILIFFGINLLL
jgi:threonine/homoserine/homoserine lactone efflux protein